MIVKRDPGGAAKARGVPAPDLVRVARGSASGPPPAREPPFEGAARHRPPGDRGPTGIALVLIGDAGTRAAPGPLPAAFLARRLRARVPAPARPGARASARAPLRAARDRRRAGGPRRPAGGARGGGAHHRR